MCIILIKKLQFQITFQFMNEYENKKISILSKEQAFIVVKS